MDKSKESGIHCETCNTYIPNEASLNAHLKGKKHLRNVERIKNWDSIAQRSLYVSGFEPSCAVELVLADYFSCFGTIAKITVDKDGHRYAIVEFCESSSAQKALGVEKHIVGSRSIIVKPREVKVPCPKKDQSRHRVVHNQMSSEVWTALLEADYVVNQFELLQNRLQLTAADIHLRELICRYLQSAFVEVFPLCEVQPFGSSVNGFGVHGCDLDLNFKYESVDHDAALQFLDEWNCENPENTPRENKEDKTLNSREVLSVLATIIKQCIPDCHKVKAILSARSPVVRFCHKSSGMSCDISVGNDLAVRNTLYLKTCCSKEPCLAPLVQAIRLWMKHWNLAGSLQAASPRLNNYAVTLLVLFYLHNCEPKRLATIDEQRSRDKHLRPCAIENWDCSFSEKDSRQSSLSDFCILPELFAGFFHFYSKIDFSKFVLCLDSGEKQEVSSLKSKDLFQHSISTGQKTKCFKYGALNIRDPFELNHNVAGNVGQKHMLLFVKCIRNAALSCDMKAYAKKPVGKGAKKEPWGILNLFVDHHSKNESKSSRVSSESSSTFSFNIASNTKTERCLEDAVSLTVTILSEVFMMIVSEESISESKHGQFDSTGIAESEITTLKITQNEQSEDKNGNAEDFQDSTGDSRKRPHSVSPAPTKRLRLSLSSPEASHLKQKAISKEDIELPFYIECEATYRVWEGRRKARRQLVQPGVDNMLELEKQVSKLLVSEKQSRAVQEELPSTSDANTSLLSNSSASQQPHFSFSLEFTRATENTLTLTFHLHGSSANSENSCKDFQNFFHHFELFLPKAISKCAKVV